MKTDDTLVVTVRPAVGRFAQDDPRWRATARELRDQLQHYVVPPEAAPGHRGAIETAEAIVLVLGSLNALRHATRAFGDWLRRDVDRKISVEIHDGAERTVHFTAKGYSAAAAAELLLAAREEADDEAPDG